MALDGSIGDRFTGERCNRRFRPVTTAYALAHFPRLVIRMKQRKVRYHVRRPRAGPETISITNPAQKHEHWVILMSDFLLVKAIAQDFVLNLFNDNETPAAREERIRPYIGSVFAGRGIPT